MELIIISFIKLLIIYLISNLTFSFLLHIISKIFGNKKEFINTLLAVSIPATFSAIIYGIIFGILFIIFSFGVNLFFIINILDFIVIIWSLWLFLSLLNRILEHKWKTFWTFFLSVILPIIAITFYINNVYNWYSERARDTIRITEVSNIKSIIWLYHMDERKLPKNFSDFSKYLFKEIIDPREWEKSKNNCDFTYKYEKISENKYKISICPESAKNIQKAKNDGWTDEKRLEFINEI